jgi:tetratricopeptide (TPR) repeat protein
MDKVRIFAFIVCTAPLSALALQGGTPISTPASEAAAQATPAQQRVAEAKQQIAADPKRAEAYNDLALAEIRRARETNDPAMFVEADTALATGLRLKPQDFQLEKTSVALMLGRHVYADALSKAQQLNKQVPDDVTVYGYKAEADIAQGNYADAEQAAQWMLNLRRNNVAGLLIGAELRALYGESAGALEFLNQAFSETPQIEPEEMAWIADRIARVELASGQLDDAAQTLAQAQQFFPGYAQTQLLLARVRIEQQKAPEAIALLAPLLLQQQAKHLSQSRALFLLALAQQQASPANAAATFRRFQHSAQAESTQSLNDNDELILYEAGLPGNAPTDAQLALTLASREFTARHDVVTLDAYAWALYANQQYAEAEVQIARALAVGVHSAQIDEHAGEIALKLNHAAQASQRFTAALQADPTSAYAIEARRHVDDTQSALAAVVPAPLQPASAAPAAAQAIPVAETIDTGGVPTTLLIPRPTGTQRAIRKMQGQVEARPNDASAYAGLGSAFFQRARETGDVEDYQLAEQALNKSLSLVGDDLAATTPLEIMAEVCMGEHRFTDALSYAQKALALGSGDLSAFATVGDAYADMGEYEKAGVAYARLQPVMHGPAVTDSEVYEQTTRTAYLTFIAGDTAGAIAQMRTAIGQGLQAHLPSENLAWLYFELGEFSYMAGDIQPAANAYLTALTIYPGDYRALEGLGKVRASQGQFDQAVTLYQSAIAVVPMPLYVAELGDIYAKLGKQSDAEKQYKLVQYIGLLGHINQVLHNRDLALFYANHDTHLPEALTLAQKEFEVRSDIYTWDALAWALYKNNRFQKAEDAMSHAMRLGTKDPLLLFHAGMISASLHHGNQAEAQLGEALRINPNFSVLNAKTATLALDTLRKQTSLSASAAAEKIGGKANHVN